MIICTIYITPTKRKKYGCISFIVVDILFVQQSIPNIIKRWVNCIPEKLNLFFK